MSATDDQTIMDFLVELSDTMVADLDVDGLLHWVAERCVELLNVQTAGIMVADERGELRLVAAAPEYTPRVRLFEVASAPCRWCFATGEATIDADLGRPDQRWQDFAEQAHGAGFSSVAAVPMRVRGDVVGVLSVLRHRAGAFTSEELRLTRALANMATIGLLMRRDAEYRNVLAAHSQQLLTGRVAVERARGILAELLDIDVDKALEELRRHAVRTGRSLAATAVEVVDSLPREGLLNGSSTMLLVHRITMESSPLPRMQFRQRLIMSGLSGMAVDSFLLAVHEAAANAQEHGGGGRLWLWRHGGSLWCEISDDGPGMPPGFEIRTDAPRTGSIEHAGLWLIRRICPDLQLSSTPHGTRLLLRQRLPGHRAGSASPADSEAGGG
ncbi:GAF domain-containing protein [Actinoplanes sp. NPDC024001]|uniref:GAF domain-containing protein n=1 Tax=Actinoplanes sp. NPDC024001 TaxID=3154598 RepID=UPI0033FD0F80